MSASSTGNYLWTYLLDRLRKGVRRFESDPTAGARCLEDTEQFSQRKPPALPSEYHDLVVEGAREHQLPESYIAYLRSFDSVPDPNAVRHAAHQRLIAPSKPLL